MKSKIKNNSSSLRQSSKAFCKSMGWNWYTNVVEFFHEQQVMIDFLRSDLSHANLSCGRQLALPIDVEKHLRILESFGEWNDKDVKSIPGGLRVRFEGHWSFRGNAFVYEQLNTLGFKVQGTEQDWNTDATCTTWVDGETESYIFEEFMTEYGSTCLECAIAQLPENCDREEREDIVSCMTDKWKQRAILWPATMDSDDEISTHCFYCGKNTEAN